MTNDNMYQYLAGLQKVAARVAKSPTRAANLRRFAAIDRAARTGQATKALQAGIDAAPNISIAGGGTGRYSVGTGWDTTLSLNNMPPVVRHRVLQSILRKLGAGYDATLSGIAGFGKGISDGTMAGLNAVGRGARAFGTGVRNGTLAGIHGARDFYRNHRQAFRDAGLIGASTAAGYGIGQLKDLFGED